MTTFAVEFQDRYGVEDFPAERVSEAIRYVLAQHAVEEGSAITVVITSDDEVRRLNAQFRGVEAPTDILSFPAEPLPDEIEDEEAPYLGDLIIAYPYA